MNKVAIHSVPRSGSSWLGQIFNSSPAVKFRFQPLFSYAFKDYLNENSSLNDINNFFSLIEKSTDSFLLQKDKIEQGIYPEFKKNKKISHCIYKEVRYHHILENMLSIDPDVIVIGLVRSPYAVINSFLESPREFRKDYGWDELEEWRYANSKNQKKIEEFYGYEKWKEVVFLFKKLKECYPWRFYLLNYDELLNHTYEEVEKVFKFSNLDMTEQTLNFILQSKNSNFNDAYSVYKTKKTDMNWKNNLNSAIIDCISKDLIDSGLEDFLAL